jgi:hypothetical protein
MMNLLWGSAMKKRFLIFIPMIVVIGMMVGFLLLNNRQTPAWKPILDRYLTYSRMTGESVYRMINAVQAAQLANFTSAMSGGSFSDSVIFQTTFNVDAQYSAGLQPMPYPPDDVWCVLLKDNSLPRAGYHVCRLFAFGKGISHRDGSKNG